MKLESLFIIQTVKLAGPAESQLQELTFTWQNQNHETTCIRIQNSIL